MPQKRRYEKLREFGGNILYKKSSQLITNTPFVLSQKLNSIEEKRRSE